jgi:DNA-binding MarR family transcriptional regulator
MQKNLEQQERASAGLQKLDPLLEHRSRLGSCVLLSTVDRASFARLKELLRESDGNLGAHLRRLEDAQYISVNKEFVDRKPVSWYSLTAKGKGVLKTHLKALEAVIGAK